MSEIRAAGKKRPKIPKVRTGCKTCKIRKVKCDETRPECKRCLAFGPGYCDGYEYGVLRVAQPERKAILPKGENQALVRKSELQNDPALEIFTDQNEYYCFRLYMEEAAPRLSFSNQSIWHHLLLQAAHHQPFIKHAIVTIGALCRSSRELATKGISTLGIQKLPQFFHGCNQPSATKHNYEFALKQYDKFLTGAKEQISTNVQLDDDHMRRTALIACLLVVCIENLQFRYTVAIKHTQDGLRLMQEYIDTAPKRDYSYGATSSQPYVIEDELVLQFKRLDLQTLSWYGARMPVDHTKVKCEGASRMGRMPLAFSNLDEARLYLDIVMRRTYHFMAYALKGKLSYLVFHDTILGESDIDIKKCFKNNPPGDTCLLREHNDAIEVEQEMYAAENRRWSQAFEPLFRAALHAMDEPDSLKAFLLKIHSTSLTVRLAGILSTSELVYDGFTHEFRQIVSLSKTVLNHPQSDKLFAAGSFSFDIGIIYPLLVVSYACRDRKLRREAIALLESKSWREAQWGSSPSVHVSKFLMNVEEDGIETDFIPEWARARLTGIEVNIETGQAMVKCIRGTGESAVSRYSVWH